MWLARGYSLSSRLRPEQNHIYNSYHRSCGCARSWSVHPSVTSRMGWACWIGSQGDDRRLAGVMAKMIKSLTTRWDMLKLAQVTSLLHRTSPSQSTATSFESTSASLYATTGGMGRSWPSPTVRVRHDCFPFTSTYICLARNTRIMAAYCRLRGFFLPS